MPEFVPGTSDHHAVTMPSPPRRRRNSDNWGTPPSAFHRVSAGMRRSYVRAKWAASYDRKVGAPTIMRRANSTIASAYNRLTAPGTSGSIASSASQATLHTSAAISVTFSFMGFLDVRGSTGKLAIERGTYY